MDTEPSAAVVKGRTAGSPRGRGPKLTKLQRAQHLERVAALYNQMVPQHEIAKRLGCTRPQISYDIKQLLKEWRSRTDEQVDDSRAKELAKINALEETYWRGWERSCQPEERSSARTSRKGVGRREDGGASLQDDQATVTKKARDGNPVFLQGVERCIEMRRRLLGLDLETNTNAVQVLVVGVDTDRI